jgi:hypothetical protein
LHSVDVVPQFMQEDVQREKRLGLWEREPALDSAILGFERDAKTLEKRTMLIKILEREDGPRSPSHARISIEPV